MDTWKLKDSIKSGRVIYEIGDVVVLFRKKGKNPRRLNFKENYIIKDIINNILVIDLDGFDYKVDKIYMMPKKYLRSIKIDSLMSKINI